MKVPFLVIYLLNLNSGYDIGLQTDQLMCYLCMHVACTKNIGMNYVYVGGSQVMKKRDVIEEMVADSWTKGDRASSVHTTLEGISWLPLQTRGKFSNHDQRIKYATQSSKLLFPKWCLDA